MENKVQISKRLLYGLWLLLDSLKDHELDKTTHDICENLESELQIKLSAIERRETFTSYKTAEVGTEDREKKRIAYLNKIGLHQDWRSQKEITF